jgi:hypothetical protein
MYSYMFPIMKYYFGCICFNLCNNIYILVVKHFAWGGGLDNYNILQTRHLVKSRLGGMHD